MSFTLDYTSMLAANLGAHRGLSEPNLSAQRPIFAETLADLTTRRQTGELAFWDLPFNQEAIDQVKAFSRRRMDKFQDFVHLGIGGSALGPIALHAGLNHPQHNLLPSERRSGCRFFCPDNVDPDLIGGVLDVIDLPHSLFHIVTKSGGTSETIAQFLLLVDLLKKTRGESWREHLVITTDPQRGFMRQFAHEQKIQTFEIAPEVGGRFTVLTPVGLLPAAMTGINIDQLCRGAREISDSCFINNLEDNPAALLAALLFLADRQLKLPIQVLFAYSNRLDLMADWFRQLWAESLGKRVNLDGQERPCGPTPVKSVGATDQHSQVQLYVEGPEDKVVLFLGSKSFSRQLTIPHPGFSAAETDYLVEKDFGHLLNTERKATSYALSRLGRANLTLEIDRIDAQHLGALFYLFEAAVLYAGAFYNVNPLDQPGVEAGKKATYALMGRAEYEQDRLEIESFFNTNKQQVKIDLN